MTPDNDKSPVDLTDVSAHLATIAKSLAVFALRMSPTKFTTAAEKANFLKGLGLESSDIARILNMTRATISVRLSEGKKKSKRRRQSGKN